MQESTYRLHDTVIKWLSVPLAIAGFAMALLAYIHQEEEKRTAGKAADDARSEREKKESEARVESYKSYFWQSQLRLYLEATKAASTLATVPDIKSPEFAEARLRFDQLFHGELCVVESSDVAGAMIAFREALLASEKPEGSREPLRGASITLAQVCRKSSESLWNIQLGELKR